MEIIRKVGSRYYIYIDGRFGYVYEKDLVAYYMKYEI